MEIRDKRNLLTIHKTKKYRKRRRSSISSIAIHHSATTQGSAEAFARYHVNTKNWPGIGYAYVVNKDGTIDFCNDYETKTYHVGNSNRIALGICLIGDFTKENPTDAQLNATAELCDMIFDEISTIQTIKAHQDYKGYSTKECPAFDISIIKEKMQTKLF